MGSETYNTDGGYLYFGQAPLIDHYQGTIACSIIDALPSAPVSIPNQIQGHHCRHNFNLLIKHLAKGEQHTSVRFAAGRFYFVHSYAQGKFITGAHRFKPAQFIYPRASQAGCSWQVVLHK